MSKCCTFIPMVTTTCECGVIMHSVESVCSEMTCYVSSGTLNHTHSLTVFVCISVCLFICPIGLRALTDESLDLETSLLTRSYIFRICRSCSYIQVKVTGSKSQTSGTKYTHSLLVCLCPTGNLVFWYDDVCSIHKDNKWWRVHGVNFNTMPPITTNELRNYWWVFTTGIITNIRFDFEAQNDDATNKKCYDRQVRIHTF